LDIPLNIEARRTGQTAGSLVGFLNGECTRDCLGIFFVGGFSVAEPLIILTGENDRAGFCAITAAGTLGSINIAGFLGNEGFEVAFRSFDFVNFSACD